MTYLDYLPDTPYAELPASAKTEISAAEYARLQVLSSSLAEPVGLPNALGLALAAKVGEGNVGPTTDPSAVAKTSGVHAGWRLFALLSAASFMGLLAYALFSSPFSKTDSLASSPSPKPEVIDRVAIQRDTVETIVRDTVTLFKTRVKIREVHDTIYLRRSVPIAEAVSEEELEPKVASKSLQQGLDWQALTVRGAGLE